MRKSTWVALVVIVALGAFVGATFLWIAPSIGKSYAIRDCTIRAQVAPNGDLTVAMSQTYDFHGDFTRVYWRIDKTLGTGTEVLGVRGPEGPLELTSEPDRPPGKYRVTDEGSALLVEAFGQLSDTTATYVLEYRVPGAAVRYSDTSALYWEFIDDSWTVPMDHVKITVRLPSGVTRDEVRAWGHGPLHGTVTIQPDASVVLAVDPLPAGTRVETSILFPAAALSEATETPIPRLQTVLDQEAQWSADANAERDKAKKERRRGLIGMIAGLGLAGAGIAIYIGMYLRFGREHRPSLPGKYFRDQPADLPPAIVDALWNMGTVDDRAVTATVVDLANRGVVRIEPVKADKHGVVGRGDKDTYQLTLDRAKLATVDEIGGKLVGFLFDTVAGDDTLVIAELEEHAAKHRKEFHEGIEEWRTDVQDRATKMGFLEKESSDAAAVTMALGFFVMLAGIVLMFVLQSPWCLIAFGVGIGMIAAFGPIHRRTREAAELYAKYRGLRDYMRDFGRLDEKPPTAVVLWEFYLVLAVVFGIADEVVETLQVKVPEVANDPVFRSSTMWATTGTAGAASFTSAFDSGFSSAAVAASPRSSSGGGGGFSGGGGGGGGGVGGGAD
jgi:uncharacterized membrane protein